MNIIYQTIDYLLNEIKVSPKSILLFSSDDPTLFFEKSDKLSDVLDVYFNEIIIETRIKKKLTLFLIEKK